MQLGFDDGILRQQPPGPGKRICCSFVSGEEERDGFVA